MLEMLREWRSSSQQEKSQPSATKQKFQEQAWKLLDVSKTFWEELTRYLGLLEDSEWLWNCCKSYVKSTSHSIHLQGMMASPSSPLPPYKRLSLAGAKRTEHQGVLGNVIHCIKFTGHLWRRWWWWRIAYKTNSRASYFGFVCSVAIFHVLKAFPAFW